MVVSLLASKPSLYISHVLFLNSPELSHCELTCPFFFAVQEDIAINNAVADGRQGLTLVQSKKELRTGFAISDPVPFVKAGVLKVKRGGGGEGWRTYFLLALVV